MNVVLKTIIRNFIHRPAINAINLFGLSVSLTLVIILSSYSYSELTTDGFHENGNEIFLLEKNAKTNEIYTPCILKEAVNGKIPGVKSLVRLTADWQTVVFQSGEKDPIISDLAFADEEFFDLFSYKSVEGNLKTALNAPLTIVISDNLAKKLFGTDPAIGHTLKYNNDKIFTIAAVFKEQQRNTCFNFNAVTSMASMKILQPGSGQFTEWGWNNVQTFLLLEKKQDRNNIIRNILKFIPEERDERSRYSEANLIALTSIYFSKFWVFNDYMVFGNLRKTVTLLIVALLVLMIALVNFINIFSSQWRERIRQFGVMKVMGAGSILIVREVMAEALVFFLIALILAIQLSTALYPSIHTYTGIAFNDKIFGSLGFLMVSFSSVFLLSIIISMVPALRISGSKAIDNLRKSLVKEKARYSSNGTLVALQFSVAIALMAFTILIQKQVSYGTSTLGINQDNLVGIKLTPQLNSKKDVLKTALENEPLIDKISFTEYYPGKLISNWGLNMDINGEKKMIFFDTFSADEKFFSLLGLQLIAGKLYSDSLSTDRNKVIVNESFLKKNNISEPIGLNFYSFSGAKAEIIGVVRDFHHKPLNSEITPLAIRNESDFSYCIVHFTSDSFKILDRTMAEIKKIVSDLSPSFPVEVTFVDNAIQNMYSSELKFRRAFFLLAVCALVISCLGILAMSISACQKRVKEIGIRRVNGATVREILIMLNGNLVKWVIIAFILSSFIAYYFMNLWLRSYAYKTKVSWWIFAISGLAALSIALATVSWQTLMAAKRNPVEALRYE
jgi:putative ABC transport system permease protein